jgi:neutral ceramidase
MKKLRRFTAIAAGVILALAAVFVLFIGPWLVYTSRPVEDYSAVRDTREAFAAQVGLIDTALPGRLSSGWGRALIVLPATAPLGGFGDRKGRPNEGTHDPLSVTALLLDDGSDRVVLFGSDLLVVTENVADRVRENLQDQAGLDPRELFFNASHTHSGPGGFAPGMLASLFGGAYDPLIEEALVAAFTEAALAAVADPGPASMAAGSTMVPDRIRNRARENAPVDALLQVLSVRRDDGQTCTVLRYSAHPTVLGGDSMLFSADYPGFLRAAVEEATGGTALFLSGAVGGMAPRAPGADDGFAKARAMGEALAGHALALLPGLAYEDTIDIAAVATAFPLPSPQLRPARPVRVSPLLLRWAGLDGDGWIHGVRLGDVVLFGTPADFSGELALELRDMAAERGADLWVTGFNGDYAGYVSPDRYYNKDPEKNMEHYELYIMSWTGPDQGALFTVLCELVLDALGKA